MQKKKRELIVHEEKGNFSFIYWIFFAIIAFIAIYLPFFGGNLRFSLGAGFKEIFETLGTYCLTFGSAFMIFGFLMVLGTKSLGYVKLMILGFLLIYISGWLIGPGIIGTEYSSPSAFHGYN